MSVEICSHKKNYRSWRAEGSEPRVRLKWAERKEIKKGLKLEGLRWLLQGGDRHTGWLSLHLCNDLKRNWFYVICIQQRVSLYPKSQFSLWFTLRLMCTGEHLFLFICTKEKRWRRAAVMTPLEAKTIWERLSGISGRSLALPFCFLSSVPPTLLSPPLSPLLCIAGESPLPCDDYCSAESALCWTGIHTIKTAWYKYTF